MVGNNLTGLMICKGLQIVKTSIWVKKIYFVIYSYVWPRAYYGQCVDEGHECWRDELDDDDLDYLRPDDDYCAGDGGTDDDRCLHLHRCLK